MADKAARRKPTARGVVNDRADLALTDALGQTALVIVRILTNIAGEHDLSLTQVRVLGILRDRRMRMAQLASYLGLERSTLSGLIDRAEDRGFVARTQSRRDGRAVEVELTKRGRELARKAETEFARALAPLTGRLSKQERGKLTLLLEGMLAPLTPQGERV